MKKFTKSHIHVLLLAGIILSACRGTPTTKSPVHLNQNMDFGYQYEAQEQNNFYADGRGMRTPVAGTVARGYYNNDSKLNNGKEANGSFVKRIPLTVNRSLVEKGKEKYEIFCTPCHGGLGDGKGMVVSLGLVPPPSYHDDRLRNVEDGYIYDVLTNGVRSMYGYKTQIPSVEERWAIVSYIRALQKSQNATANEYSAVNSSLYPSQNSAVN